jgi:iron complex outermembrane receptor protein
MKRNRKKCLATISAAALAISAGALTQAAEVVPSTDGGSDSSKPSGGLTEVVVTANKRSERAQTVPIAVAAISGDAALASGVTDTLSLANAVPGLRVDRSPGQTTPFLRGIGSPAGSVGAEPSVSLYVDDVYTPAAGAFFANFNNVDRIEVLKGPQGTLFGRNATGGVIQVNTRDPSDSPKFDASVGYGSYDTVNGSLYGSDKLTDKLSANISAYGGHQGQGWGRNLTTGQDSFKTNWNYGGRIKLLFEPSSETRVLLTVNHDTTSSSEGFYHAAPGTVSYGGFPAPAGFYDMLDDTDPLFRNSISGVSAKISHEMSWAKLVSITAYQHAQQFLRENQAGAAFPLIHVTVEAGDNKTFTQELQLLSTQDSAVTWLAGFFYMNDRAAYDPLNLSGLIFPGAGAQIFASQKTSSYSGFGQVDLHVAKDTRLTLGLRDTVDDRKLEASATIPGVFSAPAPNSPQSKSFSKPTWRVSLDHAFTPDIMAYVSYNRGFKSGGYNTVVFPGAPIGAPVEPETLDAYAVGVKSEFIDHRLQINAEAFDYKYKNIQVQSLVAGGTILSNAASAKIKGVDVDVRAIPVENLTLTASFEYLDAHYDSYVDGTLTTYSPGCAPAMSSCNSVADLSGFKLPFSAPFSASLVVNYLHRTSIGQLDFNVAYNHGGDYYFNSDNGKGQLNPSLNKQPAFNLLNTSVQWTSASSRYVVTLWGRNITGEKYLSLANEQTVGTGWGPAPPATYGITFGIHLP